MNTIILTLTIIFTSGEFGGAVIERPTDTTMGNCQVIALRMRDAWGARSDVSYVYVDCKWRNQNEH